MCSQLARKPSCPEVFSLNTGVEAQDCHALAQQINAAVERAPAVLYLPRPPALRSGLKKSWRAAAGRAELLAKRRSIGEMQTPAELVPIPSDP